MTTRITTGAAVFADSGARTITGVAVTFGTVGRGSIGPTTFAPGSIVVPDDVTRVKLFRDHRDQYGIGTPVGWLTHVDPRPDGLYCTFAIGVGPDGDQALQDAQGVRDGLSIEISGQLDRAPDGTVRRAHLAAVALVPTPAFADARVLTVTYSETPEGATMPDELTTPVTETPRPAAEAEAGTTTTVAPDAGAGVPVTPGATAALPETVAAPAPASAAFASSASRPVGVQVVERGPSFGQVADYLQTIARGEAPSAAFALADITSSAFTPEVSQPGWLGELWSGAEYQRTVIPLITTRPLTHWKMVGWRWTTKPSVGPWAGDKTEIPTNTPATEPVEVIAARLAAGWDFDRKFVDFNDNEFMASFLRGAIEDYRFKTDQLVAVDVVAKATQVAGTAPDLLRAVARGNQAVRRGTRTRASFALVNDIDLESLLDFSGLDVPAFLSTLGINPDAFVPTDLVPQGTVVVGHKSAYTFYELPGSPVRVNALDLARGGVDHAVYGYHAELLSKAAGLVKVAWATPPTP
ncbi:hypothetical protein [Nocardia sp. NPDC057272]|uniref:hypothetical protein n=1 Tax=Nocardia sp. NPDC057272 TaxID=3346079 RepID=UPI0036346CDA